MEYRDIFHSKRTSSLAPFFLLLSLVPRINGAGERNIRERERITAIAGDRSGDGKETDEVFIIIHHHPTAPRP